jgi:L-asparaginase
MAGPTPSVLVYATGGTIGMHETSDGRAPDPTFPAALEDLIEGICAPLGADFRVNHQNPPLDSANASADTAPRIAAAVRARARTLRPRGVVILHGTDTLAYSASRLTFEFDGLDVPVVLTGSRLPYDAEGSDAPANLELALRTALRAAPGAPVSVAFGGRVVPAARVTKYQVDACEAFRAERPLVAGAEGTGVVAALVTPDGGASRSAARILSFRFVPGVAADDLRAAIGGGPDGLVLECYGSGGAPVAAPGMIDALREVCAALPVVAVTQCSTGGIDFARYAVGRKLQECGAIDGGDLTLEAAIGKLGYLMDRGVRGEALSGLMLRNLVGECSGVGA